MEIMLWEKPVPDIPEVWSYEESVNKVKPIVLKWKMATNELLEELYIAREMLSCRYHRDDGTNDPSAKTWADYCEEIGLAKRTANRWLVIYAGDEGKTISDPDQDSKEESEGKEEDYIPGEFLNLFKKMLKLLKKYKRDGWKEVAMDTVVSHINKLMMTTAK